MPKKLTLAQVAKMARAKDAAAWDSLSPAKQQEMVDRLNGLPDRAASHKAALANLERVEAQFRSIGKKPKRPSR